MLAQINIDNTMIDTAIHVLTTVVALIAVYVKLSERLTRLEEKVDVMYGWFRRHIIGEKDE